MTTTNEIADKIATEQGLTKALAERDKPFGDYRTGD